MKFSHFFIYPLLCLALLCSCTEDDELSDSSSEETEESEPMKSLTANEYTILGTWAYYSSGSSEYRCITFNSDRTACYFEISRYTSSAIKGNKFCYDGWYIDETGETTLDVYVRNEGEDEYWVRHTINTDTWILYKNSTKMYKKSYDIECEACD